MHVLTFFAAGLVGAFVGWVLALLLRAWLPDPPHTAPTRLGWAALALGLSAAGTFALAFTSGAFSEPLRSGDLDPMALLPDPAAWSAALAGAGLFTAFMASGRVGDRRWPTGLGLLLSGAVVVLWLVLMLSRIGEFLLMPH